MIDNEEALIHEIGRQMMADLLDVYDLMKKDPIVRKKYKPKEMKAHLAIHFATSMYEVLRGKNGKVVSYSLFWVMPRGTEVNGRPALIDENGDYLRVHYAWTHEKLREKEWNTCRYAAQFWLRQKEKYDNIRWLTWTRTRLDQGGQVRDHQTVREMELG